ncbi:hypothetical protein Anapl_16067 [Anas platyrhynchos]|uniref:Uncharacterized protein n=1 Tax=Anas platyrhynchos TaxID=8839 RepID=R0JA17_ANAPL|nr:hypothetical protein Anapl_16067 [Anas platyrhynchos]
MKRINIVLENPMRNQFQKSHKHNGKQKHMDYNAPFYNVIRKRLLKEEIQALHAQGCSDSLALLECIFIKESSNFFAEQSRSSAAVFKKKLLPSTQELQLLQWQISMQHRTAITQEMLLTHSCPPGLVDASTELQYGGVGEPEVHCSSLPFPGNPALPSPEASSNKTLRDSAQENLGGPSPLGLIWAVTPAALLKGGPAPAHGCGSAVLETEILPLPWNKKEENKA